MSDATTKITPGTVSKILWHFTGGPTWNIKENRQNKAAKPAKDAYKSMVSILESKELRIGSYSEVVKIRLKKLNRKTTSVRSERRFIDKIVEIKSNKVCCLADIPLIHLGYHSYRYGKFAIGFHRDSAIKNNFNPVLYSVDSSKVVKNLYRSFYNLRNSEFADFKSSYNVIDLVLSEIALDNTVEIDDKLSDLQYEIDQVEDYISKAFKNISQFLSFVKTFDKSEFGSIYTEREWRSTEPFSFDYNDVAMVVLPKKIDVNKYYEKFLENEISRMGISKYIPIVPWEDLVEH